MKSTALITSLIAIGVATATAGEYYSSKAPYSAKAPVPVFDEPCFRAGEFNFDAIGMFIDPVGDGLEDGVGGGVGLGYFFTENFGVNTRAYWWDGNSAIHSITASAVLRAPIQDICLAPYVFGGVGGHFDSVNQVSGHAGGGLEYRLTDSVGIFADYSYTWADETDNWHGYSLGVRFVF